MPHTIAENLTRLQNAKTAIGNAITAKGGTVNSGDGLEEFAADIATIPSGGTVSAERKDVNFYDYDGSIVYSYTADEFAELSALPANPTHAGLTSQGWNWSLADAKAYVADYGMLDIGQMYITDDGKTRLYITLTEGRLKPYLGLTGNSAGTAVSIDWDDGSAVESVTLGTSTVYTPHEYASSGDYVIKIEVTSGSISFKSESNSSLIRKSSSNLTNEDKIYKAILNKIEIGSSVSDLGTVAFSDFVNLKYATIPSSVGMADLSIFTASGISCVVVTPATTRLSTSIFNGSTSLRNILIPSSVTTLNSSVFRNCTALTSINLPPYLTTISPSFYQCSAISNIVIPLSVTDIGANVFQNCYGLAFIKFTPTTPPSVGNVNAWTSIPSDCYILVPYDTLDDYLNETNMPDDSTYLYLCFAKYASGVSLPTTDSDGYSLTWYATKDDARNGVNPITVGNGKEIYAIGV